jgi:hypothetical protein
MKHYTENCILQKSLQAKYVSYVITVSCLIQWNNSIAKTDPEAVLSARSTISTDSNNVDIPFHLARLAHMPRIYNEMFRTFLEATKLYHFPKKLQSAILSNIISNGLQLTPSQLKSTVSDYVNMPIFAR